MATESAQTRDDYRRQVADAYDEVDRVRKHNAYLVSRVEYHRARADSLLAEAQRQDARANAAERTTGPVAVRTAATAFWREHLDDEFVDESTSAYVTTWLRQWAQILAFAGITYPPEGGVS